MKNCIYCQQAHSKEIEFEDEHFYLISKQSETNFIFGELVAKAHSQSSLDCFKALEKISGELLDKSVKLIQSNSKTENVSISCNIGEISGQVDNHLIFKLIPRFNNEYYCNIGIESWLMSLDNSRQNAKNDGEFLENLEDFFS